MSSASPAQKPATQSGQQTDKTAEAKQGESTVATAGQTAQGGQVLGDSIDLSNPTTPSITD